MKAPLVIGYKGEIGSFILQGLLRTMPKASNIWCYDINETEQERVNRIKKADVIFLCIPLEITSCWFDVYRKLLKDKTIIEQCSLKEMIKIKHKDFKLLSMHILFRPSATFNKKDRSVLLIDQEQWSKELVQSIKDITDSEICWIDSCKKHDESMAYEQALIHRVILSLASVTEGKTYIGKRIFELRDRIKNGDPKLYKMIQGNKHLPKAVKEFNKNLKNFNRLFFE